MPYALNLEKITLEEYRALLNAQNLLPSRRILWQDIDANFARIASQGVETVAQLEKELSSPAKLAAFAQKCGVDETYLNILRREAGSFKQKPVLLSDFPGMDRGLIQSLCEKGIKTSKDYWEKHGVQDELYGLCDMVRINGVGPTAAKALYEAGYASAADVAKAGAMDMLRRISQVNEAKQYYKAVLTVKDMQFIIDFARTVAAYEDA